MRHWGLTRNMIILCFRSHHSFSAAQNADIISSITTGIQLKRRKKDSHLISENYHSNRLMRHTMNYTAALKTRINGCRYYSFGCSSTMTNMAAGTMVTALWNDRTQSSKGEMIFLGDLSLAKKTMSYLSQKCIVSWAILRDASSWHLRFQSEMNLARKWLGK